MNQPPQQPFGALPAPITAPTYRDVLNGRGQGVQRHPGNVKYRTLVFVNKGLYAKCPRNDKIKISKGIVAAVRELGGRFLELDERTGIYKDIGDKKATEKTSQALREGQTKIRKQMYKDEEMAGNPTHDTSLLAQAAGSGPGGVPREISAEGYFGYSVQVLESLYNSDEGGDAPAPTRASAAAAALQPPPLPAPAAVTSVDINLPAGFRSANTSSSSAVDMALDQFPGAQMPPPLPQPPAAGQALEVPLEGVGRFTNELGRPSTRMSMGSLFSNISSVRQLLDTARADDTNGNPDRNSMESILSSEIRDLIRLSEPQLMQVENERAMNDANSSANSSGNVSHEDREVVLMDADGGGERVSELRFTDIGGDLVADAGKPGEPNPRSTNSTQSTSYSNTSLMDATMMTIGTEDMSTVVPEKPSGVGDMASAELLLRLSNDKQA